MLKQRRGSTERISTLNTKLVQVWLAAPPAPLEADLEGPALWEPEEPYLRFARFYLNAAHEIDVWYHNAWGIRTMPNAVSG